MSKRQFNTTGVELLQQLIDNTKLDESTGCLLWQGYVTGNGYPQCTALNKRMWSVHRLVLYLTTGYEGSIAMHSCDVPRCINPDHLSWSTQKSNIADAIHKQRYTQHKGEKNYGAKLTEQQVDAIRAVFKAGNHYGLTQTLAKEYGVHRTTIQRIRLGIRWKENQ